MDDSPPFDPVPLRARRDGWTAARQRRFVALIARGWTPGRAAARLGMRRQGAYALRARPGAEGFAAAWDEAAALARRRRIADRASQGLYARAVEGAAVPVRHRRRIVAVERRYDNAALIRLLGIVDRAERKAMNGQPGLSYAMDAELLSAFRPVDTLPLDPPFAPQTAIGGGEGKAHPLEDVDQASDGDP